MKKIHLDLTLVLSARVDGPSKLKLITHVFLESWLKEYRTVEYVWASQRKG